MFSQSLVLNALRVERGFLEELKGWLNGRRIWKSRTGYGRRMVCRKLPDTQDDLRDQRLPRHSIHLLQEDRFEERELLQPH